MGNEIYLEEDMLGSLKFSLIKDFSRCRFIPQTNKTVCYGFFVPQVCRHVVVEANWGKNCTRMLLAKQCTAQGV